MTSILIISLLIGLAVLALLPGGCTPQQKPKPPTYVSSKWQDLGLAVAVSDIVYSQPDYKSGMELSYYICISLGDGAPCMPTTNTTPPFVGYGIADIPGPGNQVIPLNQNDTWLLDRLPGAYHLSMHTIDSNNNISTYTDVVIGTIYSLALHHTLQVCFDNPKQSGWLHFGNEKPHTAISYSFSLHGTGALHKGGDNQDTLSGHIAHTDTIQETESYKGHVIGRKTLPVKINYAVSANVDSEKTISAVQPYPMIQAYNAPLATIKNGQVALQPLKTNSQVRGLVNIQQKSLNTELAMQVLQHSSNLAGLVLQNVRLNKNTLPFYQAIAQNLTSKQSLTIALANANTDIELVQELQQLHSVTVALPLQTKLTPFLQKLAAQNIPFQLMLTLPQHSSSKTPASMCEITQKLVPYLQLSNYNGLILNSWSLHQAPSAKDVDTVQQVLDTHKAC